VANLEKRFGWGGRIRTFTVLINSEVSYQLDHAPEDRQNIIRLKHLLQIHQIAKARPCLLGDLLALHAPLLEGNRRAALRRPSSRPMDGHANLLFAY
jgi:hypothetical protein